jgi:hypothetical protein
VLGFGFGGFIYWVLGRITRAKLLYRKRSFSVHVMLSTQKPSVCQLQVLSRATFARRRESDTAKVLRAFYEGLSDAVCYTVNWLRSSLNLVPFNQYHVFGRKGVPVR